MVMTIENKKIKLKEGESGLVISLSNEDYPNGIDRYHDDPMVITTTIHNYIVKRILVDQGSLVYIMYNVAAGSINIKKSNLSPHDGNLISFSRK